jgi:hypothetical protein
MSFPNSNLPSYLPHAQPQAQFAPATQVNPLMTAMSALNNLSVAGNTTSPAATFSFTPLNGVTFYPNIQVGNFRTDIIGMPEFISFMEWYCALPEDERKKYILFDTTIFTRPKKGKGRTEYLQMIWYDQVRRAWRALHRVNIWAVQVFKMKDPNALDAKLKNQYTPHLKFPRSFDPPMFDTLHTYTKTVYEQFQRILIDNPDCAFMRRFKEEKPDFNPAMFIHSLPTLESVRTSPGAAPTPMDDPMIMLKFTRVYDKNTGDKTDRIGNTLQKRTYTPSNSDTERGKWSRPKMVEPELHQVFNVYKCFPATGATVGGCVKFVGSIGALFPLSLRIEWSDDVMFTDGVSDISGSSYFANNGGFNDEEYDEDAMAYGGDAM